MHHSPIEFNDILILRNGTKFWVFTKRYICHNTSFNSIQNHHLNIQHAKYIPIGPLIEGRLE